MNVTSTTTLCSWAAGSGAATARSGVWAGGASNDTGKYLHVRLRAVQTGAFAVKLVAALFVASSRASSNIALNLAPFGRWTRQNYVLPRRLALR
jgi:hypothetical protein